MQPACAAAAQVFAHERKGAEHGEAFESEQDLHTGLLLDESELFEVLFQQPEINDIRGRVDRGDIEGGRRLVKDVRRGEHGRARSVNDECELSNDEFAVLRARERAARLTKKLPC